MVVGCSYVALLERTRSRTKLAFSFACGKMLNMHAGNHN
uniref:Uncharacterized protein n=1 Tax=Arundo donax TaxID=35708 RepID=A0A0A9BEB1_ARUDO